MTKRTKNNMGSTWKLVSRAIPLSIAILRIT